MLHLYCGDGKGKTTAAMGLALRMTGRGGGVVVAQFLKGTDSGERQALALLPQVTLLDVPQWVKFIFQMVPEEQAAERRRSLALLEEAEKLACRESCRLLVLDEVCGAVSVGLLPLSALLEVLDRLPAGLEVVLTGRDPAPELLDRADYITEMKHLLHPFAQGQQARPGIEY